MRWRGRRHSSNIEDRRGASGGGGLGGGFPRLGRTRVGLPGGRIRIPGGGRGGLGGLAIIAVIFIGAMALGVDPATLVGILTGDPYATSSPSAPAPPPADVRARRPAGENDLADMVAVVLADTEDTWHPLFKARGRTYREPTLVLFTDRTRTACGQGQAAMGPFYCPADQKVYLDLSFFQDLRDRHDAPGDFAQAYVVAHEVGHHVQTLLGISNQVRKAQAGLGRAQANALSVRQELQADCFAGLWAFHAARSRDLLEAGDVAEALTAASAIGDDRLQREAQGRVMPDSFTHGTSDQRVRWFRRGYDQGTLEACDTFGAERL